MLDFILVGQGISGTMLSHFLMKKNASFVVFDQYQSNAASNIAAGLINPITGRHFIKSWMVDTLIPFALKTYEELENKFNNRYIHRKNITMIFDSINTENNWNIRSGGAEIKDYVTRDFNPKVLSEVLNAVQNGVEFTQSSRIDLKGLVKDMRKLLKDQRQLIEDSFNYDSIVLQKDCVKYEGLVARSIIFCEGYKVIHNPFFNYLPFVPAKGDVLMVRIKNYPFDGKIIKHGLFIVPYEDDFYWVGSTYHKSFKDDCPAEEDKQQLMDRLCRILKIPFQLVAHKAAIRPTVRDRKPFIGTHPDYNNVFLFNGMGAKGSYLSPFFGDNFINWLCDGSPLHPEVDLKRYEKYYSKNK